MHRSIIAIKLDDGPHLGLECGHPPPSDSEVGESVDCESCDRREIPPTTSVGRQTPVFDSATVPPALLEAHQTNAWAELVVIEGQVDFYDEDPPWQTTATPEHSVVIVPKRAHHVEPSSDAQFFVQFHDLP